nr:zf-CCHC domain-containing protein/DUF4219 domain-containing protein/UBN2 domain-containing protein [Tanacetum cinerariifolium]
LLTNAIIDALSVEPRARTFINKSLVTIEIVVEFDGETVTGSQHKESGKSLFARDNLDPHLQIDAFPGRKAEYPLLATLVTRRRIKIRRKGPPLVPCNVKEFLKEMKALGEKRSLLQPDGGCCVVTPLDFTSIMGVKEDDEVVILPKKSILEPPRERHERILVDAQPFYWVSSVRYSKIGVIHVSPSSSTTASTSTSLIDFYFSSSTNNCLLMCAKLVDVILLSASTFLFSLLGTCLIENALKPLNSVQDDPFVNRIHGSGSSSSISIRISRESSSSHSTMKSTNICPLTDTLGLKYIVYSPNSMLYFCNLPATFGLDNTCCIGWSSTYTLRFLQSVYETLYPPDADSKDDRLARYLLIQRISNDIYSLIDSNETAKDLWDALERQMRGSEYGEQDRKSVILFEYETFKATEGEHKCNKKVEVQIESEGSDDEDISDLKMITALLEKAFNRKRICEVSGKEEDKNADVKKRDVSKVKCYNYKKEGHFARDCKKAKVQDYNYYKTKMLLAKKDSDEQVLLAEDQAWMESNSDKSSSSAKKTIAEVAYYTSESESESEYETSKYYDKFTNYGLFVNNDDDQEIFHDAIESSSKNFIENHNDSQKDYDKSKKRIEKVNQQSKDLENQNKDLQDKYNVLINQVNTFEEQSNKFNEQMKVLNEKNDDLLAQTEVLQDQIKVKHVVIDTHTECQAQYAKPDEERYEYMIRYSTLCDNDKQHRKKIDEQEILFDKMSRQLVEMNNNVLRLQEKILEK